MKVGYARVSSQDQNLDSQIDALNAAGCERVFSEVVSGAKTERSVLNEALSFMRAGDTLVVWKLDRLGRSLRHLIDIVTALGAEKKGLKSLREEIDTSSSAGRLFFHVMGALAEFEREVIRERTKAGLSAARSRGRRGGRPRVLDKRKEQQMGALYDTEGSTVREICETMGISKATFYRRMSERGR